jgi:hypothetical protein
MNKITALFSSAVFSVACTNGNRIDWWLFSIRVLISSWCTSRFKVDAYVDIESSSVDSYGALRSIDLTSVLINKILKILNTKYNHTYM